MVKPFFAMQEILDFDFFQLFDTKLGERHWWNITTLLNSFAQLFLNRPKKKR